MRGLPHRFLPRTLLRSIPRKAHPRWFLDKRMCTAPRQGGYGIGEGVAGEVSDGAGCKKRKAAGGVSTCGVSDWRRTVTLYHMITGEVIAPVQIAQTHEEPKREWIEYVKWFGVGLLFMALFYLGCIWAAM